LRCDDARQRLLAHAWDHEAGRHLESCAACFAALESADPLAGALRGARPDDAPAPSGLTDAVLARWLSGRSPARRAVTGLAVVAIVVAGALELIAGAEPARLAGLGTIVSTLADGVAGALTPLVAVRSILFGEPAVLTAFGAVTAAACALWLRLALRPPVWRWVR
jgi:hypothetical protein